MLVKWSHGPVGSWEFEGRSESVVRPDRTTAGELVDLCQHVAEIVEEHDLLQPAKVMLAWVDDEKKGSPTILEVGAARDIGPVCRAALDAHERRRGFRNLTSLEVLGQGTVIGEARTRRTVTNLMWLHATTLVHHTVSLNTQADVWLPYGLNGRPQPDLARYNAPRLEAAVRAVGERLQLVTRAVEMTDYAFNDGYRLRNFVDQAGGVIDVIYRPDLIEPEEDEDDL